MSDIDERIKQALSQQDQAEMEAVEEQAGLFEMIGMALTGRQAWFSYYMYIMGFLAFFAWLWMTVQFFAATDVQSSLEWLFGIITCLFMFTVIKIIGWQQMQKLEIMREIKRLEMRVILAASKDSSTNG
ncbi:MAG: DUF6768 family protein [Pseudohongiellaceae bacterium]